MRPLLVSACLLGAPCRYDGRSVPLPEKTLRALRDRYKLIPVCPESAGGLPTPRIPSERQGDRVVNREGRDVTEEYRRGAALALTLAQRNGCAHALLKERSPSCGCGTIYDGSFTGTVVPGDGVAAAALMAAGLDVYGESAVEKLFDEQVVEL